MRLYRSTRDKRIFGVCGGLGDALRVDSTILRVIALAGAFFSGGAVVFIYVLAAIVLPKEPTYGGPDLHRAASGYGFDTDPFESSRFASYKGASPYGSVPPSGAPHQAQSGYGHAYTAAGKSYSASQPDPSELDSMMRGIETKAMKKEIEELRTRLARYEQNQSK